MKKLMLLMLSVLFITTTAMAGKKVIIYTEYGNVTMELFDNTPQHRDNFLKLVNDKFYDGTLFHRIIPEFMIQGGDPDSRTAKAGTMLGNGDVGYKIPAEINQENFHQYGALAAARDNNPEKESSGCQFYISVGKKFSGEQLDQLSERTGRIFTPTQREVYNTIGGTPHLDGNYTVFGQVIEGMDVVEKIIMMERDGNDRPRKDVRMIKVRKKKFLGIF